RRGRHARHGDAARRAGLGRLRRAGGDHHALLRELGHRPDQRGVPGLSGNENGSAGYRAGHTPNDAGETRMISFNDGPPPRSAIGEEEWRLRVDLAACYRIFAMLGWTELIYNHITVRIPGPDKHFVINPFGLHYSEVTASNLVRIDLQGNIVGHSDWPVNPAGFTVHAAIHDGIPGAHCVMHTHTTAGMAVACSQG